MGTSNNWEQRYLRGPNVVLDLVKKSGISRGWEVLMDNLFTSFPLLEELSKLKLTELLRPDKILNNIPIITKTNMERSDAARGKRRSIYSDDIWLSKSLDGSKWEWFKWPSKMRNFKECTLNGKRGNNTAYMYVKCYMPLYYYS